MKKKEVKLIQWLDMGIFPGSICFSSGFTIQELKDNLKALGAKGWLQAIDHGTLKDDQWYALHRVIERKGKKPVNYFFIIIPGFDFSDESFFKLAHEILHIIAFYLPDILNRDREFEAEGYLHTHIFRQCLQKIRGKGVNTMAKKQKPKPKKGKAGY